MNCLLSSVIRRAADGSSIAYQTIIRDVTAQQRAEIGDFAPVRLAFAWVQSPNAPLILGQTNFFMEFEVCFYRSSLEFEGKPRSSIEQV